MKDVTFWKPHPATPCEDGKVRTVYVYGQIAPFVGWIACPDTVFSCQAYVRVKGRRVRGYVGNLPEHGDAEPVWGFIPFTAEAHKLA